MARTQERYLVCRQIYPVRYGNARGESIGFGRRVAQRNKGGIYSRYRSIWFRLLRLKTRSIGIPALCSGAGQPHRFLLTWA